MPVDHVADALVHLLDTDDEGVFNLVAGENACTADQLMKMACDRFEKPVPPVVAPGSGDESAGDHGAVYLPYFDMEVVFDDSHARDVLEPAGVRAPLLTEYFGRLIDYAETVRWGKRSMTREEALERIREPEAAAA